MTKDKIEKIINIRNRKASHDYELLDFFTAGIVLGGTEIKCIRQSKCSFQDSFCVFQSGKLVLKKFFISLYESGSYLNHEPTRDRFLLLKKIELRRLIKGTEEKGLTIIPVRIFINDRGLAKMEIALAKGKKNFDKREDIKAKDIDRDTQRAMQKLN